MTRFTSLIGLEGTTWITQLEFHNSDDALFQRIFDSFIIGLCSRPGPAFDEKYTLGKEYAKILPLFQERLCHIHEVQQTTTLAITFLLSFYELFVWNDAKAWMMHLDGMMKIVKLRGPHAFKAGIDCMTFKWFRQFAVGSILFVLL